MTAPDLISELKKLQQQWLDYEGVIEREFIKAHPIQGLGMKETLKSCRQELRDVLAKAEAK